MDGLAQVAAAILIRDAQVLLGHRSPGRRWYPNVWDLIGGHVEKHESPAEALVREVAEEVGVRVAPPTAEPRILELATARLHVWAVTSWTGEVVNQAPDEHQAIQWFTEAELPGLEIAEPEILDLCLDALGQTRTSGDELE